MQGLGEISGNQDSKKNEMIARHATAIAAAGTFGIIVPLSFIFGGPLGWVVIVISPMIIAMSSVALDGVWESVETYRQNHRKQIVDASSDSVSLVFEEKICVLDAVVSSDEDELDSLEEKDFSQTSDSYKNENADEKIRVSN